MNCKRVLLAAFVVLLCLVPVLAAEISGKWTATIKTAIGDMNYAFDFKVEGETHGSRDVMGGSQTVCVFYRRQCER
jgi:hypothetical protein